MTCHSLRCPFMVKTAILPIQIPVALCVQLRVSHVNSQSTCRGRCYLQSCSIWSTFTCMWLQPMASTCWGATVLHRPTEVMPQLWQIFMAVLHTMTACSMQMVLSAGPVSVHSACWPSAALWPLFVLCPLGRLLLWWDDFKTIQLI